MEPSQLFNRSVFVHDAELRPVVGYLTELRNHNVIDSVDYHFAMFIDKQLQDHDVTMAEQDVNFLVVVSAALSNQVLQQHTCLDLNSFNPVRHFKYLGFELDTLKMATAERWQSVLMDSGLCCLDHDYDPEMPFVLLDGLLYFNRYYQYELKISQYITKSVSPDVWFQKLTALQIEQTVSLYFTAQSEPDLQRKAVANAVNKRFSVISGGPGTGKTTTVVKLLLSLQTLKYAQDGEQLNIALLAPTGKAAQRLGSSIASSLAKLQSDSNQHLHIPDQGLTIHRFLRPVGLTDFAFDEMNPVHIDAVVLDEASMVDTSLMSRLMSALPAHCQLILLGDKQQLASVEAGNVLADIANVDGNPYVAELLKSYRFGDDSEIGQLANAIKQGLQQQTLNALTNGDQVRWLSESVGQLTEVIEMVVSHFVVLHELAQPTEHISHVFEHLSQLQLLSCIRQGTYGVEGLNSKIRQRLAQRLRTVFNGEHYHLRPIMITENAYHIDLYNGDIGVEVTDPVTGLINAYFYRPDGETKIINCQRLPQHETCYAMTVHKSQGSEFTHTIMVLPEGGNYPVDRALLYTGLTRSKQQFSLLGSKSSVLAAVNSVTNRRSGLTTLIQQSLTS